MRGRALALGAVVLGCSPAAPPGGPTRPPRAAPSAAAAPAPTRRAAIDYPESRRVNESDTWHGVTVPDPYRWLEDGSSPEVTGWMKQQDERARAYLHALPERAALVQRLAALMYVDATAAPLQRQGRLFYSRQHATKEKAIVYWRAGRQGPERVLLDPNGWSADGSAALTGWQPSWDGRTVAYKRSENNSDEATLHVLDVDTGQISTTDSIAGAKYASPSWTPDSRGFYYTWLPVDPAIPADERPGHAEVRYHELGTDPAADPVFHPRTNDASQFLDASVSRDGRFLLLNVHHGWTASDAYVMELDRGLAGRRWRPLAVGGRAHYYLSAHAGAFYVQTDEGASRYQVFRIDPRRPDRADWQLVVPEQPDATLTSVQILGGRLALTYLRRAASVVVVRELDGTFVRELALPAIGTVGGPVGLAEEDTAYFTFESFTVPPEVHATSLQTGHTELHARPAVPIDPTRFAVEQVVYRSKDGTPISMFLVKPHDFVRDGTGRVLLSGYGGFQISESPEFRAYAYPWLERGGLYAVPNLRGGGEYGEQWHRAGMLLQKQNVFDDFLAAAEYLVAEGYTRPERLVIRGGSNGGLLVGAAMTQRPGLFGAVLCGVPLLDMIRYDRFGSGKTWRSEYGSAEDPAQFRALLAYSPYHHVQAGTPYPPLLLLSADSDDRVDPMHARKFAAAMQAASTGGPVVLRIETKAGHGGADRIQAAVDKSADEIAFALAHTAR